MPFANLTGTPLKPLLALNPSLYVDMSGNLVARLGRLRTTIGNHFGADLAGFPQRRGDARGARGNGKDTLHGRSVRADGRFRDGGQGVIQRTAAGADCGRSVSDGVDAPSDGISVPG